MKTTDLIALLQDFYRDKVALRERHIAGASRVSHYDFNNAYQYIVNREDSQVAWLRGVLEELGAGIPAVTPAEAPFPAARGEAAERAIVEDDVRLARGFVERWRPRVEAMTHARHRTMLRVILGETLEQQRAFTQMLDGRQDVLGRRTGGETTGGGVLPVRWIQQ